MLNGNELQNQKKFKNPGSLYELCIQFLWCAVNNVSITKAVPNQYLEAKEINTAKHATLEEFSSIVALQLTVL